MAKKGLVMMEQQKKHAKKPINIYFHLTRNTLIGLALIVIALSIGMLGYHQLEGMPWIDSFLNASMILSGMGPATNLATNAGKIFAGVYALFSGLAFIAIFVIMLSPIVHVFFRKIHLENGTGSDDE